ncbi:MAG: ATPase, T2SS/T4P/T4SS family [Candidatus Enteromonas sp.]
MSTMNERLKDYLEDSFLSPLLKIDTVTDISYNGERIFFEDSSTGRHPFEMEVTSMDVGRFLRQIANYSEKQFSYMNPILDVSFSRYRLNATFLSLTRVKDEKSYSFSLRIGKEGSAIKEDDLAFWGEAKPLVMKALQEKKSIVIAGETGSGKTELQKYLLSALPPYTRVIVIDNVEELELSRGSSDLDMTSWLVDERMEDASFSSLIRNGLRNNPDYLIVAESRGKEMLEALHCVMSGHPILTTLHAKDIQSIPSRIARMAMMSGEKLVYGETLKDVYHHFPFFIYLKKECKEGRIYRYIDSIAKSNERRKCVELIYKRKAEDK